MPVNSGDFLCQLIEFELAGVRLSLFPGSAPFDLDAAFKLLSSENIERFKTFTSIAKQDEFVRTRHMIRHAAGLKDDPLRDPDGFPLWPNSLVGSVSHSQGHVIVGVADSSSVYSVGIDLDADHRIKPHLAEKICLEGELELVQSGQVQLNEVFVAKEALFKCHFPLGRKRFWFHDAETVQVSPVPSSGQFMAGDGKQLLMKVLLDTGERTPAGYLTAVTVIPLAEPAGYRLAVTSIVK